MSTSSSARPDPPPPLADPAERPELVAEVLKGLGVGVAVVDRESWAVELENARFFEWFPPDPESGDALPTRVPGLDLERASNRIESDRSYELAVESGSGARAVTLEVSVRGTSIEGGRLAIVECRNVTDRKQAELMLDSYSRMADNNARDLKREKERAEKLLLNIMPRSVYEEMKDFGSVSPQRFDEATILMLDFVGSTEMAVSREAGALVSELNDIFSAFDRIVELFNCERMKTIGDAYMAVAGLPEPSSDHAASVARVALRLRRYLERRNRSHPEPWLGRIGIHSGPVVGSIVGVQRYVYDIFGPGVNMAARLEALSEPMQITVSQETYDQISEEFTLSERGEFEVKGFGAQTLYSLDAEDEPRRG